MVGHKWTAVDGEISIWGVASLVHSTDISTFICGWGQRARIVRWSSILTSNLWHLFAIVDLWRIYLRSVIVEGCRAQRQRRHIKGVLILYAVLFKSLLVKFQLFGGKNWLAEIGSPFVITWCVLLFLWRDSLPFRFPGRCFRLKRHMGVDRWSLAMSSSTDRSLLVDLL